MLVFVQLEKEPTFGSIESTDAQKRDFAFKSWQFNLDNKVFTELFPEIVQVSSTSLRKLFIND